MNQNNGFFAGPVVMLLSAAILGFFGFSRDWSAPFPDGQVILFMVVLGWTLRITACIFVRLHSGQAGQAVRERSKKLSDILLAVVTAPWRSRL